MPRLLLTLLSPVVVESTRLKGRSAIERSWRLQETMKIKMKKNKALLQEHQQGLSQSDWRFCQSPPLPQGWSSDEDCTPSSYLKGWTDCRAPSAGTGGMSTSAGE